MGEHKINSEEWKPSIVDLSSALEILENYFGKLWFQKQIKDYSNKPKEPHKFTHHLKALPHPIIPIYLAGVDNFTRLKEKRTDAFDVDALKLISFSDVLREVEKIGVINLNGELLPIKSWDKLRERLKIKDEFNQVSYEMQIASALRKSDLKVFFIQESKKSQEKTPDLIVKAETPIYIECKYRGIPDRERNYSNIFNEFYWRTMRLMYSVGKFYSVCVEWQKDPVIDDAIVLTDWLKSKISNGEQGHYKLDNAQIWIKLLALQGEIFDSSGTLRSIPH